jgi:excisionase family DNA binding protein
VLTSAKVPSVPAPSPKLSLETVVLAKLLFSQREAAGILGISVRTLQNLIGSKQIPVRRIGRRVLIHRKDLEMFARRDHAVMGVAS